LEGQWRESRQEAPGESETKRRDRNNAVRLHWMGQHGLGRHGGAGEERKGKGADHLLRMTAVAYTWICVAVSFFSLRFCRCGCGAQQMSFKSNDVSP
jgi:hypothetical protein